MIGAALVVLAVVVVIPVGVLMVGGAVAALLGSELRRDGEARNAGSELVELNR